VDTGALYVNLPNIDNITLNLLKYNSFFITARFFFLSDFSAFNFLILLYNLSIFLIYDTKTHTADGVVQAVRVPA
jgi:hypothetical protein